MPPSPGLAHRPFQELLIRFQEEEAKLLPPGLFFPLLEDYRLLPFIDRWVVSRITQWIRAARAVKQDWEVPRNNINLSADTLYDPQFAEFTRKHIQTGDLPAGALSFEITWPDAVRHAEPLRAMAATLKEAGCGFTVADFDGTEDAFATIEEFAPDFIKISSGIVRALETDASDSGAVESIHLRCRSLGIETIAESVESDALRQRVAPDRRELRTGFRRFASAAPDLSRRSRNQAARLVLPYIVSRFCAVAKLELRKIRETYVNQNFPLVP